MSDLESLVLYFCKHYPHKDELSKARLTKMVYLADWRSAITERKQLSDLRWTFNHYGPYVDDVVEAAELSRFLRIRETTNMYGSRKEVVEATVDAPEPSLSGNERLILDHVIQETQRLGFNDFIKLVYSTYPIVTRARYHTLDLVELAGEYEELQANLAHDASMDNGFRPA
ncbi:Panacea domain-containing protein [Nocardioides baculatus]|uniref:SocA family protein n=1 Tax=Nocardioides baculatus TaxID=2801337 RepID=A0ABS1LDZ3_9ACTN|nr:Panacea domain-containing protein [Nocardioides baculatus]MBL0749787.1 SocA family protein [Nocardioides baculatus]